MKKILIVCVVFAQFAISAQNYGTVNGEKITDQDVKLIVGKSINLNTIPKADKTKILDQIVKKKLLMAYAMKSGVPNSKGFKEAMHVLKGNLALEYWMQKEVNNIKVSDTQMKTFYDKNRKNLSQKAVMRASHILLKTKSKAQELITTLNKSQNKFQTFKTLAKQHSIGPTGPNGGDLGWFEPKSMVPQFSKAASKLNKNNYSKTPIKTKYGYHIIYLEDKKPEGTASYDDSKAKIIEVLKQKKLMDKINKKVLSLEKKASIKLN